MAKLPSFDDRLGPNGKLMHELSQEAQIERWWGTVRCADAMLTRLDLTDAERRRWINERDAAATMIRRILDRQEGHRPPDPFASLRRYDAPPKVHTTVREAPKLSAATAMATKPRTPRPSKLLRSTLPEVCPACLNRPGDDRCPSCGRPPSGQMRLPL